MQMKSMSKVFVWILLGMVIVGLGGFGLGNFGSVATSLGTLGDRDILIDDYVQALNDQTATFSRNTGMTVDFAMLESFGLDEQVLEEVINRTALDLGAEEMGLGISDEGLVKILQDVPAFQDSDGSFDKERYFYRLENAGITAAEFEDDLRGDQIRALLFTYLAQSNLAQEAMAQTATAFAKHTRKVRFSRFTLADLDTPPAGPTQAQLQTYFDENGGDFLTEEVKRLTVLWLTPEDIADPTAVEREVVENLYQSNFDVYNQPEKRFIEQLIYPSEAEAQAALGAVQSGEKSFDDLIADRGLSASDVELGPKAKADLPAQVAEAVFAAEVDTVVGPIPSEVGRPALYLVSAVQEALAQTVDDVYDELALDIARDRARRALDARQNEWSDQLFGGARLEEISPDHILTVAYDGDYDGQLAGYDEFHQAAQAIGEGDFPEILRLEDDSILALRLEEIIAPKPKSFDEVRGDIAEILRVRTRKEAMNEYGQALAASLLQPVTAQGRVVERDLTRGEFYGTFPQGFVIGVFEADLKTPDVAVENEEGYAFVVLGATAADATNAENATTLERQRAQIEATLQKDMVNAFAYALREDYGYRLDQSVLDAVHTQMRQGQ